MSTAGPDDPQDDPQDDAHEDPLLSPDEDGHAAGAAAPAARGGRSDAALMLFDFRVELATVFGVGHIPFASGTFGSAVALPLAYLFAPATPAVYVGLCVVLVLLAIWSSGAAAERFGLKDPHAVVIDEVAGQMIALAFVPRSLLAFAAGFVLFRFFDVAKPFPADRLERLPGGAGIVLDDVAAAIYANLVLQGGLRLLGPGGLALLQGMGG